MTPERVRAWQAIFRDVVITLVAAFMLIWQCVIVAVPNTLIVGAGVTLLVTPAAIRLDSWRKAERNDDA